MKRITLFILLFAVIKYTASSQSCLPNGITFNTQAEIDNFQTNYPDCTEIGGDVKISGGNITNLDGLSVLTSISGNLTIGGNYDLLSLTGLGNLTTVGGDLSTCVLNFTGEYYIGNPSIIDFTGLENLTFIGGSFTVRANNSLTSLTGLDNLDSIGGSFIVLENYSLISLSGLDNLNSIGGSINVGDNQSLTSLTSLENLNSINGDLYICNNDSLSSCEVQWLCDYLSDPGGSVNIFNNAPGCNNPTEIANSCGFTIPCLPYGNYYFLNNQTDIDSFQVNYPNCTDLKGFVIIHGPNITNLTGLDNVTSIGGNLTIDYTGLIRLTGLEDLTSIGGYLNIDDNYHLTTLSGLDNIEASSITDLTIFWNQSLSTCAVQSVCEYLASPNGNVNINYNASGCAYQYQVMETCETVAVDEVNHSNLLSIYPNPSSTQITVELPDAILKNTYLTIYNINTQLLIARPITEQKAVIDISGLPRGLYFIKVADDRTLKVGKLIKN